jgi:hypothetical protein
MTSPRIPVISYSEKLRDDARSLRQLARLTVTEAKKAVAHSHRLAARIKALKTKAAAQMVIVRR